MLYFILISMALVAGLLATVPLVRSSRRNRPASTAVSVAKDQLMEIDQDVAAGRIGPDVEEATRLEVERRLLDAADAETVGPVRTMARPAPLAVTTCIITLAISAALYGWLGAPEFAALQARFEEDQAAQASYSVELRRGIELLQAKIGRGDGSSGDWITIGRAYTELRDFQSAQSSFEAALAIDPENAVISLAAGESMVLAGNGTVSPDAVALFEDALTRDPELLGAAFYIALAHYQAGNLESAYDSWLAIAAKSSAGDPWMELIAFYLKNTAQDLGIPAPELPARNEPATTAAILEMVEQLSDRLEREGGSVDQWVMLGRSYSVLNRFDLAVEAYGEAVAQAPGLLEAQVGIAEAMAASDGTEPITERVLNAFESVLAIAPADPRALYMTAIGYAERGDTIGASRNFTDLLQQLAAETVEYQDVRGRLSALDE